MIGRVYKVKLYVLLIKFKYYVGNKHLIFKRAYI